jgi:hypothetical protein
MIGYLTKRNGLSRTCAVPSLASPASRVKKAAPLDHQGGKVAGELCPLRRHRYAKRARRAWNVVSAGNYDAGTDQRPVPDGGKEKPIKIGKMSTTVVMSLSNGRGRASEGSFANIRQLIAEVRL